MKLDLTSYVVWCQLHLNRLIRFRLFHIVMKLHPIWLRMLYDVKYVLNRLIMLIHDHIHIYDEIVPHLISYVVWCHAFSFFTFCIANTTVTKDLTKVYVIATSIFRDTSICNLVLESIQGTCRLSLKMGSGDEQKTMM